MSAAIEVVGVEKSFEAGGVATRVLHGVDLALPAGELALLVGPSGCGKTTLISIIAGILSASKGEVRLFGETISALPQSARVAFRRRNIGFVFQQYNLLPSLTAAENAAVPLIASGMRFAEAVGRARTMLERLGMAPHEAKLPRQLSGGQQQRVAIARALVHSPRLIVCDEPTAALDARAGRAAMTLIRDVAVQERRAVVVVTHDHRVHDFADRIATMEDGRVASIEAVERARPTPILEEVP